MNTDYSLFVSALPIAYFVYKHLRYISHLSALNFSVIMGSATNVVMKSGPACIYHIIDMEFSMAVQQILMKLPAKFNCTNPITFAHETFLRNSLAI